MKKLEVEFTKYEMDGKDYYVPTYETEGSAGADARAVEGATINPGEIKLVKTGFGVQKTGKWGFGYRFG